MKNLGIETSTDVCSVALSVAGIVTEDTRTLSRTHNEELLGMLDRVFERANVSPRDLDQVAFGAGPGSFTGIRIAASVAQAIAFASAENSAHAPFHGRPHDRTHRRSHSSPLQAGATITPISSSFALASAALDRRYYGEPGVITVNRSRRGAYYIAAFEAGSTLKRVLDDALRMEDEPLDLDAFVGWSVVGEGADWLTGRFPRLGPADPTLRANACDLLRVLPACVGYPNPESGLPIYLPADSPWKPSRPGNRR